MKHQYHENCYIHVSIVEGLKKNKKIVFLSEKDIEKKPFHHRFNQPRFLCSFPIKITPSYILLFRLNLELIVTLTEPLNTVVQQQSLQLNED